MARCGFQIGVVVVAVREPCAVIEKKTEALVFEVGAIALQVVRAELVDDDDHDQFWMGVVGIRARHGHCGHGDGCRQEDGGKTLEHR